MRVTQAVIEKVLREFAIIFPAPSIPDPDAYLEIWQRSLGEYEAEQVQAAALRLMSKLKRFPWLSDLVDEIESPTMTRSRTHCTCQTAAGPQCAFCAAGGSSAAHVSVE